MKAKTLSMALIGSLVGATSLFVVSAAADTINLINGNPKDTSTLTKQSVTYTTDSIVSGLYTLSVNYDIAGHGVYLWKFLDSSSKPVFSGFSDVTTSELNLIGGKYTFSLVALKGSNNSYGAVTARLTPVNSGSVPVPGPVAGGGIGSMIAFAVFLILWRSRRVEGGAS